jgi:hypothetical protein
LVVAYPATLCDAPRGPRHAGRACVAALVMPVVRAWRLPLMPKPPVPPAPAAVASIVPGARLNRSAGSRSSSVARMQRESDGAQRVARRHPKAVADMATFL